MIDPTAERRVDNGSFDGAINIEYCQDMGWLRLDFGGSKFVDLTPFAAAEFAEEILRLVRGIKHG